MILCFNVSGQFGKTLTAAARPDGYRADCSLSAMQTMLLAVAQFAVAAGHVCSYSGHKENGARLETARQMGSPDWWRQEPPSRLV